MTGKQKKQYFDYETSIFDGTLFFEDCSQAKMDTGEFTEIIDHKTVNSIRLFSLDRLWCESVWIDGAGFQKEMIDTELTLRAEMRSGRKHWYAYRRVLGTLHKRYIGDSLKVTQQRLLEVCRAMPTTKIAIVKA